MSEVTINLKDKDDGTLGVQIITDGEQGQAVGAAMMFIELLQQLDNKPQIITEH
jgi:hypothetical protein